MKQGTRWIIKIIIYILALGYLFLPIDLSPDVIPIIGVIDDAVVIIIAIMINSGLDFLKN